MMDPAVEEDAMAAAAAGRRPPPLLKDKIEKINYSTSKLLNEGLPLKLRIKVIIFGIFSLMLNAL